MKKILFAIVLLAAVAAGAMMLLGRGDSEAWTTGSPAARAELERGLDALMKYYREKAVLHFRKAIELDPDFVAPRFLLLQTVFEGEERERLLAELREMDLDGLSKRERFLVDYALAREDGDTDRAEELMANYLDDQPGDPYALMTCSAEAWEKRDWEKAESRYRQLIETDPNWVAAQNRLGYIAMAQGKFEEAEEAFRKYHYIAPDQANPHDSMGELLSLIGRYDEAREAFGRALEIDPGFCAAYFHLVDLAVLAGDFSGVDSILAAAAEHCNPEFVERLRCNLGFWKDFLTGDYEAAWTDERAACREALEDDYFILHQLAVATGRFEWALEAEDRYREVLEEVDSSGSKSTYVDSLKGLVLHMEGVRLAAQGDLDEAQSKLLLADDHLLYWGDNQGILKLYNLLNLAALLDRTGDRQAARGIVEKVRAVNPEFAKIYDKRWSGLPAG